MATEANLEATDAQATAPATAPADAQDHPVEGELGYALSQEGKRTARILLVGVVSIWVFALWSLITILENGITGVEWVSSLLMLGILLVAPLVAWALLEEINSSITISEAGIRYRSLAGIDLAYGWDDIEGFQGPRPRGKLARFFLGDEETPLQADVEIESEPDREVEEEPETRLLKLREGREVSISNTLVAFLHRQAHGGSVPIYGGLGNRDELLDRIRTRLS